MGDLCGLVTLKRAPFRLTFRRKLRDTLQNSVQDGPFEDRYVAIDDTRWLIASRSGTLRIWQVFVDYLHGAFQVYSPERRSSPIRQVRLLYVYLLFKHFIRKMRTASGNQPSPLNAC